MPGKVKVKIISGRNLPVMDRSSDTTDAYVEIKLGNTTYKTDVCRKSLHPHWNSEWYRFEVDDSELQDEPLQIRLMDHDTYSANDAIGKVYLDLNPLLLPAASLLKCNGEAATKRERIPTPVMSGWIPVYDTMHGIRGEVNITVKVELFSDFNKFRQSSCGVQFFYSPTVPHGYYARLIHGFVEELVVNDDPEYQWIDKIRPPRVSNEARQTLFFKLSGELQRKVGVKALDLGGNAVIGYSQSFDLEGDFGIVARAVGTAVTLVKVPDYPLQHIFECNREEPGGSPVEYSRHECGHQRTESMGAKVLQSPAKVSTIPCIHRRSSDSDLSITPKGNSLTGSDRSSGAVAIMSHFTRNNTVFRPIVPQDNFDIMEYPFLTMSKYPPGFIAYLGGAVSARSVKLLERISNIEEPESRDTWWSEIRMEIRSHAKAYNCNSVLGYSETTSICDDVCVLSASGTAAIIGYQCSGETADSLGVLPVIPKPNVANRDVLSSSLDRADFDKERKISESVPIAAQNNKNNNNSINIAENLEKEINMHGQNNAQSCVMCHLPYTGGSASMRGKIYKCAVCKSGKVPEILIATIELPEGVPCVGRGCFLQSYISRPIKDLKGESYAKEISDGLPFLEYELHRILVNKLKVKGMNAIFGLKIRISIGEKMLIGIATGTAIFLSPLPSPPLPKLVCDRTTNMSKLAELQKQLHETIRKNKETYQLRLEVDQNGKSDSDDSEDEQTVLDLGVGNKDCCILEVDDPEDVEILNLLMELRPPDGFHVVNTELVPGLQELEIVKNLQMFIQIWRAKIQPPHFLEKHFQRLLETVYFKLRRMIPCALCDLQFRVESPEPDEIQLCVLGMALGLGDPQKNPKPKGKLNHIKRNDEELIFNLEEDNIPENSVAQTPLNSSYLSSQLSKNRQKSPQRCRTIVKQRHVPYRERHGVDITPLSYVPGGKIERYLGNLNFFFIRETTSVREEGGFSAFIHSFVTEVLAIIRAHVTALGGNAMVAYFMTECVLNQNIHKNQGQCLINVGGDVVYVSYFSEDQ